MRALKLATYGLALAGIVLAIVGMALTMATAGSEPNIASPWFIVAATLVGAALVLGIVLLRRRRQLHPSN